MDISCKPSSTPTSSTRVRLQEKKKHPCFSCEGHEKYARIHLPVAPQCNIECNYCNRKYDCLNESRPGVCSQVLTPEEALKSYLYWKTRLTNMSVVGIAGPGDALANWARTRQTFELVRQADKGVMFCLSTNGLLLPEYSSEIVKAGVGYVTVTVNCLDPLIGQHIYRSINYRGLKYNGPEGAEILINHQIRGLEYLCGSGIVVKVNIVALSGINDWHIPALARSLRDLGVSMCNIMPLIPVKGTVFAGLPQTSASGLLGLRRQCEEYLPQMYHCRQCRADAVGLLDKPMSLNSEERSRSYA